MTINSAAGWSLIIAVVLGLVGSLFTPGGMLMEPADPANFVEAAGVLGDNAPLAQYATFLFVISVVFYWFGLSTLRRAFSGGSVMDRVSSFALNIFLVGYAFLIVELSIRHILIHVLEHGVGASACGRTGYSDDAVCGGWRSSLCIPVRCIHRLGHIRMRLGAPEREHEHLQAGISGIGAHGFAQLCCADDCGAHTSHRPARGGYLQQHRAVLRLPVHTGHRRGDHAGSPGVRGRRSGLLGSVTVKIQTACCSGLRRCSMPVIPAA